MSPPTSTLRPRRGSRVGPDRRADGRTRPAVVRAVALVVSVVVLLVAVTVSLSVGSRDVPVATVWAAIAGSGAGDDAAVVLSLRIPRTVLGLLTGAALGVSGAVIQAATRNPLADPGLLGVTSGAAFAVAMAVGVLGVSSPAGYVWFALLGALVATVAVFVVGGAGGSVSPVRVVLAGVAVTAVLTGVVSAMVLADPRAFSRLRAWEAGSLADRGWEPVLVALPFVVVGLVVAALLGGPLDAVALGDDLAQTLGAHVVRTRLLSLVAVTLLAGAATAMAGPVVFVGLMVPHVARWAAGPDQRWVIGLSLLLAPVLLLVADVVGRVVLRPGELQVGIVTAFLGAPVLVALVRGRRVRAL